MLNIVVVLQSFRCVAVVIDRHRRMWYSRRRRELVVENLVNVIISIRNLFSGVAPQLPREMFGTDCERQA